MSLEAEIERAIAEEGLQEITLRVSRYADLSRALHEPAAWQAIAKYQGRPTGPWGVGIRAQPVAAMLAALEDGRRRPVNEAAPADDIFG